jgi:drug/metabolite transporter (DMT)-like permease
MPTRARIALLTACFLWAISFIATKVALEAVPPLTVVAARLLVSAVVFAVWLIATRRSLAGVTLAKLPLLFVLSLFGTGLHYSVQTIGIDFTTASNASVYAVTGPISIMLLSAVILRERITLRKGAGLAVALVGVLLVMGPETLMSLELKGNVLGDLLVMASIFMWGLFTVLGKAVTDELGALRVTAVVTMIGAGWMLPVGAGEVMWRSFSLAEVPIQAWLAIGFLGVGCSFLATLLYFVALQETESQKVGLYMYTIPPMTAVVAMIFLGERLDLLFVAGAALIFAGVALTERG